LRREYYAQASVVGLLTVISNNRGNEMGFVNLQPEMLPLPEETVMSDNSMVWSDYMYVADGKPYRSDYHGIPVRQLKNYEKFKEVRRFDSGARYQAGTQ
jgi:hypothetical protein